MITMKIAIVTRSNNQVLYERASSFWPTHVPRHRLTGYDHWRDALSYLHDVQNVEADVVVNCDEDCYILHWDAVERLIQRMRDGGHSYAGMPDTQLNHPGRNNGWFVHNPFFSIFFPRAVQQCLLETPWYAHAVTVNSNPDHCPHQEVFNNFFAALNEGLLGLHLRGSLHADRFSTELMDLDGKPFALHSWYGRSYDTDEEQHARIDALYADAQRRSTPSSQKGQQEHIADNGGGRG